MFMLFCKPLRQWWQTAFTSPAPTAIKPLVFRPSAARSRRLSGQHGSRPVTPFRVQPSRAGPTDAARLAARRFWMTLDPDDQRRAAIGGTFAEVCAALERLAALDEKKRHA